MPENKNSPIPNKAADYDAVYQNALQIIRQSWLDAGMTPEEYDAQEKRSEVFRQRVEMHWAIGEGIDDLLAHNSEQLASSAQA